MYRALVEKLRYTRYTTAAVVGPQIDYGGMALDCKRVANTIKKIANEIKEEFQLNPRVSILLPVDANGQDRVDSRIYVSKKLKLFDELQIPTDIIRLPLNLSEADATEVVHSLGKNPEVTGIMVQLPFPTNSPINAAAVINQIDALKDIDGLSMASKPGLFCMNTAPGCLPATPLGILSLLDYYRIQTEGKHVVIIGKGQLVGQPLAALLAADPYKATVTSCDIHTQNIRGIASAADILIVAIGSPHAITADFVKPGGLVIDVGINRNPNEVKGRRIVGDVSPSAHDQCGLFTPVPGGVGLLTVASLAFNAVNSALQQAGFPKENLSRRINEEDRPQIPNSSNLSILLFSSAYNGMTQRIESELLRRGHKVRFQVADSADAMRQAEADHCPDLIICPTLMTAIPEDIYSRIKCLIVHPGIKGDRGPSSLDWAILEQKAEWGVTLLEASREMDAGNIWATGNFKVPPSRCKTGLYSSCVVDLASKLVLECVNKFQDANFRPEPLNQVDSSVRGKLHETIKQSHKNRIADFRVENSKQILRKILAADGQPGLKATIWVNGEKFTRFLYGGTNENILNSDLKSEPGSVIARRGEAICIATIDGAIWVSQLRTPKSLKSASKLLKLPATLQLGAAAISIPEAQPENLIQLLDENTFQEISFKRQGSIGFLAFNFYNGAMSTLQCNRFVDVIQKIASTEDLQALVFTGGPTTWSNGIHLGFIQGSSDPAAEAYDNIRAINEVVKRILSLTHLITVSAIQANAGAGGVYLGLATDFSFARSGTVLNPHYKNLGLYGSELHTYVTLKRMGNRELFELKDSARPLLSDEAARTGLLDHLGRTAAQNRVQLKQDSFLDQVHEFTSGFISNKELVNRRVDLKYERYEMDTQLRHSCEDAELGEMYQDIFDNRNYFAERRAAFLAKTIFNAPVNHKSPEAIRLIN